MSDELEQVLCPSCGQPRKVRESTRGNWWEYRFDRGYVCNNLACDLIGIFVWHDQLIEDVNRLAAINGKNELLLRLREMRS